MHEVDIKVERVARLATSLELAGLVLGAQPNFAWLTGGQSNRIDGSREAGAGALVVAANGRRYVVANTIEMPRLLGEALSGLGFEPVEIPWTEDRANPKAVVERLRAVIGPAARVGSDLGFPETLNVDAAVSRLRVPLTPGEVDRYRALGRDVAAAMGRVCRGLVPDLTEREVAGRLAADLAARGARPIVLLVGGDERLSRFRHPVPTGHRWRSILMAATCAERDGLVVAASRIVAAGAVSAALADTTARTAEVFGRLVAATRPGTVGRDLFEIAVRAYAGVGAAGEELKHHQGGAIGYRSRDWVAHPASEEVVQSSQAFAWNPSITGSKVEDTVLVGDEGFEPLTSDAGWPTIEVRTPGGPVAAAGVLRL